MTNKDTLFNSLSFGSLILAKRSPNTGEIEYGHRNGPFLVLSRKDDKLVCLYATSKENKNSLIKILKNNYNLNKDTYITSFIKLISIDDFLTSLYYLSEREIKNLSKVLYINGLENYICLNEPSLEIGDIIQLKHQHLIIGETDDNYIIIKAEYNSYDMNYHFDYNHRNLLQKNVKYKRVAFLSDEEINKCITASKRTYNFQNCGKFEKKIPELVVSTLKVGNLIAYKDLLYYLYYEIGNKKLSFSVSKNQTPISQEITIGGNVYYANFGLKQDFDEKQENTLLVATATEEEKQKIKEKRRKRI